MSKKPPLTEDDIELFRRAMRAVSPLAQTLHFSLTALDKRAQQARRLLAEQTDHCHYFSMQGRSPPMKEGPVRFIRDDVARQELKKLSHGAYKPDIFLDLHGKTQQQAQREVGAMLAKCYMRQFSCACIVHGHGKNILKQAVPVWLTLHPMVLAFHQAPAIWGGDAALIILLNTNKDGIETAE